MTESLVLDFGPILAQKDWSFLGGQSTHHMVETFQTFAIVLVNYTIPEKEVTIIEGDKLYVTYELRQLI